MLRGLLVTLLLSLPCALASAQHVLTVATPYQTDFDGFTAAGFAPEPSAGQLDSDLWIASPVNTRTLDFGGTSVDEDFANGPSMGGEMAGGVWAFGPLAHACGGGEGTFLGVQPSVRTFTPGAFQVRLENGTGAPLERVEVRYALAVRNDEGRSLLHAVSLRRLDSSGDETERIVFPSSEFTTPEASAGGAWRVECRSLTAELGAGGAVEVDGRFTIAFELDDEAGSGSRDEVGISDLWISAESIPAPVDAGMPADGGLGDAGLADAGPLDSGLADGGATDAGFDAGTAPDASGPMDAATAADAAVDAASPSADAGPGTDRDGGCGCSVPMRRETPWGAALAAGALALVTHRRRRR